MTARSKPLLSLQSPCVGTLSSGSKITVANLVESANQAGRNTSGSYAAHPRRAGKSDPSRDGIGGKSPDGVSAREKGEVAKRERDTRSKATEKEIRELLDQVKQLKSCVYKEDLRGIIQVF